MSFFRHIFLLRRILQQFWACIPSSLTSSIEEFHVERPRHFNNHWQLYGATFSLALITFPRNPSTLHIYFTQAAQQPRFFYSVICDASANSVARSLIRNWAGHVAAKYDRQLRIAGVVIRSWLIFAISRSGHAIREDLAERQDTRRTNLPDNTMNCSNVAIGRRLKLPINGSTFQLRPFN